MKKFLGALLMIVTMVAFTSNAVANDDVGDNTEIVATELVATVVSDGDAGTVAMHLLYFYPDLHYSVISNTIASKEDLTEAPIVSYFINDDNYNIVKSIRDLSESVIVIENSNLSYRNIEEVHLPEIKTSTNSYLGNDYSKVHLPFEVGLNNKTL